VTIVKTFVRQFVDAFVRNDVLDLAAQVAYYAILALFPFAMFLLTLMGYIPLRGLDREVMAALYQVVPPDAGRLVEATMHEILGQQRGWLLVSTLFFALWTASGALRGLTTALNRAYEVVETRPIWRVKLRALVATLASVVAAIIATTCMLVGPELLRQAWRFFGLGGGFDRLWAALRWPLAVFAMTSMVAFMYHFLPNVQQRRRYFLPGSLVAVLGWLVASFGFRLYVAHFAAYAHTYGALGTVVVLLLWLYIWGVMVIVGGQINAILDRLRRHIVHAEKKLPRPRRMRAPFAVDSKETPA
jgi:membrane protein